MKNQNSQRQGYTSGLTGYVTQLDQLVDKNSRELAISLGFKADALADGYGLYFLLQHVALPDFRWKDRSRFSAGQAVELVEYRKNGRWVSEYAYVDRYDQMRHAKNRRSAYPDDWEMDAFIAMQLSVLNVRSGPRRIAKVVPVTRLGPGDYPDAPGNGVPQWEIMVEKQFICAALVHGDQKIKPGVFDASYT